MMLTIVELAAKGWQYLCWISGGAVLVFLLGYIVAFLVDWLETYAQICREEDRLPKSVGLLQEYDVVQDGRLDTVEQGLSHASDHIRDIQTQLNYDVGGLAWMNAELRRLRENDDTTRILVGTCEQNLQRLAKKVNDHEKKLNVVTEHQANCWERMNALCSSLEKLDASRRVGDGLMREYDKHQREVRKELSELDRVLGTLVRRRKP